MDDSIISELLQLNEVCVRKGKREKGKEGKRKNSENVMI
jgi:hypothetical protein